MIFGAKNNMGLRLPIFYRVSMRWVLAGLVKRVLDCNAKSEELVNGA